MACSIESRMVDDSDRAVEETTTAPEDAGVGVLCDVDVQATLKRTLDVASEA